MVQQSIDPGSSRQWSMLAYDSINTQLSRKFFTSLLQPSSCMPSYPFTYSSGSYNCSSIKICKQISTPHQPYQKIPDIYFLRCCTLPKFISIPSPITIQFVVDVFVLYVILYLLLHCLLCYLVLRPQSSINSTTTTTTTDSVHSV